MYGRLATGVFIHYEYMEKVQRNLLQLKNQEVFELYNILANKVIIIPYELAQVLSISSISGVCRFCIFLPTSGCYNRR